MDDKTTPVPAPAKRSLASIVDDLLIRIEEADGEITDAIDQLELSMSEKIDAYHAVMRQWAGEAVAFEDLAAGYQAKSLVRRGRVAVLKGRLAQQLDRMGVDKAKGLTTSVWFQCTESVDFNDEDAFCLKYADTNFVRTRLQPNKTEIKAQLKGGLTIAGAHIVITRTLQLR